MTTREEFEAWYGMEIHPELCVDLWEGWKAATERAALICEERSGPLPGVGAYSALLAAADAIRGCD